jgi:hypothetical protein
MPKTLVLPGTVRQRQNVGGARTCSGGCQARQYWRTVYRPHEHGVVNLSELLSAECVVQGAGHWRESSRTTAVRVVKVPFDLGLHYF